LKKKTLPTWLIVSALIVLLAAWEASGYVVDHKIHQREVGTNLAPTHSHS
jgi:hypothetical protein